LLSHPPLTLSFYWSLLCTLHCCRTKRDWVTDNEYGVNNPVWARSDNSACPTNIDSFLLVEVGRDSPSCDNESSALTRNVIYGPERGVSLSLLQKDLTYSSLERCRGSGKLVACLVSICLRATYVRTFATHCIANESSINVFPKFRFHCTKTRGRTTELHISPLL
jgi:hypothetical protein